MDFHLIAKVLATHVVFRVDWLEFHRIDDSCCDLDSRSTWLFMGRVGRVKRCWCRSDATKSGTSEVLAHTSLANRQRIFSHVIEHHLQYCMHRHSVSNVIVPGAQGCLAYSGLLETGVMGVFYWAFK